MVGAVGIEPTTCRLRAVHFVLAPATTGCHKFLSIVGLPLPSSAPFAIGTPQIMTDFEGAWVQSLWVNAVKTTEGSR
jgi:hypothetical protein